MLELCQVSKAFRGIPTVEDVSYSARAGEVTGYLGPNGLGKPTTMKIITGLLQPSSGMILFHGKTISEDWIGFKQKMGYVPEESDSHLSGLEYLVIVAQLRRGNRTHFKKPHHRAGRVRQDGTV